MLNYQNDYFLQSTPFTIRWAGFESDTLTLQNNGWTIAVEDCFYHALDQHELRFILKHDMLNLHAITRVEKIYFSHFINNMTLHQNNIPFHIQIIAKEIMYTSIPEIRTENLNLIDCSPEYIKMDYGNISELSIFKTLVKPDNALIIEPDKISSILQQIVDAQAPNQKEIRERMRRKDSRDAVKQTLHAQILTVAS